MHATMSAAVRCARRTAARQWRIVVATTRGGTTTAIATRPARHASPAARTVTTTPPRAAAMGGVPHIRRSAAAITCQRGTAPTRAANASSFGAIGRLQGGTRRNAHLLRHRPAAALGGGPTTTAGAATRRREVDTWRSVATGPTAPPPLRPRAVGLTSRR